MRSEIKLVRLHCLQARSQDRPGIEQDCMTLIVCKRRHAQDSTATMPAMLTEKPCEYRCRTAPSMAHRYDTSCAPVTGMSQSVKCHLWNTTAESHFLHQQPCQAERLINMNGEKKKGKKKNEQKLSANFTCSSEVWSGIHSRFVWSLICALQKTKHPQGSQSPRAYKTFSATACLWPSCSALRTVQGKK